jgi:predicted dehydrogenase
MGRHHARLYTQIEGADLVGVVDPSPERRQTIINQYGGRGFETVQQLLDAGVDAVTIATPTVHHRSAAEPLLSARVACLIEKPLAPNAEEAMAMARLAGQTGAVLQVGHIVRYDPVMLAIRELNLRPRFIEVDRISPMTFRSVDVSVVLDMMIHDLDVLLMLIGSEPQEIHASAVSVLSGAEDVCNARLVFPPDANGRRCVANVTASRLAMKTERKMRLISEDAYVSADFAARSGTVVRKTDNAEKLADLRAKLEAGVDLSDVNYLDLINIDELKVGQGEPLRLQLEDFLDAVRQGRRPEVDALAGFAAVRTAERIIASSRQAGSTMV